MIMPKRKPGTVAVKQSSLTVRFPDELLEELRVNAIEGDRSLNAEILRTVRQALAARKEGDARNGHARPRKD